MSRFGILEFLYPLLLCVIGGILPLAGLALLWMIYDKVRKIEAEIQKLAAGRKPSDLP